MNVTINLNDYVRVKLKPEAVERYNKKMREEFKHLYVREFKSDEEGYTKLQLHDFISSFGDQISMVLTLPVESPEIEVISA